jgi:hypothetical protein
VPLPGALVIAKGSQTNTTTDKNGTFKISAPPLSELSISYIGFNTQIIPAKDSLNVALKESARALSEVVVVGYGSIKKTETTGSVSTISAKTISDNDTGINKALQGRVAGVQVLAKSKSGSVSRTITGTVTDKNDHSPIPGVSIMLSGKTAGTVTNTDGTFKLIVPTTNETLVVAFIGYKTQTIKLKGQTNLKIEMEAAGNALAEVMVTNNATSADNVYEAPHPAGGWSAYNKYLKANATMPDGTTGKVKLIFMVDARGAISNIATTDGTNNDMTKKAISLVVNGKRWIGASDGKATRVRLKIKFHK